MKHHPKIMTIKKKKKVITSGGQNADTYLVQSSKSSLHGLCSSLSRHPATTSRGMSGRWAADFKGCIEKTEMYQRSDPHQISCRGTKVYYWEQALEGTSCRLVWSSLSRAKSKCLSVWHIPYIQSISHLCSADLLPKGHGFLSTDQQTAFSM